VLTKEGSDSDSDIVMKRPKPVRYPSKPLGSIYSSESDSDEPGMEAGDAVAPEDMEFTPERMGEEEGDDDGAESERLDGGLDEDLPRGRGA